MSQLNLYIYIVVVPSDLGCCGSVCSHRHGSLGWIRSGWCEVKSFRQDHCKPVKRPKVTGACTVLLHFFEKQIKGLTHIPNTLSCWCYEIRIWSGWCEWYVKYILHSKYLCSFSILSCNLALARTQTLVLSLVLFWYLLWDGFILIGGIISSLNV